MSIVNGALRAVPFFVCASMMLARPAAAHHGRDFLLLETDDMPAKGQSYAVLSVDTKRNAAGDHATEITPGVVLGLGKRLVVEPHFHLEREPSDEFRYAASAVGLRYRLGDLGRSGWRGALSAEAEITRNRAAEPSGGSLRLIAARTFPKALVAVNLITGREFTAGGDGTLAIGAGVMTPLKNGDQIGLEAIVSLPTKDGFEILPSYAHRFGKNSQVKLGIGWFHAPGVNSGTLHAQWVQRF